MSTVVISYFESERNLLWTEEIEQSRLGDALVDAQSRGETARAAEIEAAQAKLAKESVPFQHRIDTWKRAAARVRVAASRLRAETSRRQAGSPGVCHGVRQ